MRIALEIAFALATVACIAPGEPVLQNFAVWAAQQTYQEKASLYHGWTNGFLSAAKNYANQKQQKRIVEFAGCLESMVYPQAGTKSYGQSRPPTRDAKTGCFRN
jgi:hypothetical protein